MTMRLTYEDSCKLLLKLGLVDTIESMRAKHPAHDEETPPGGVSFYKTRLIECDLRNLTLPRTLFGRSLVGPVSFANSDLSESNLCWNDFEGVDFGYCDLSDSDLRASNFVKVSFLRTDLHGSDLRRSSFDNCDFTDADMCGAKLTRAEGTNLKLSEHQIDTINWHDDDGPEPGGG